MLRKIILRRALDPRAEDGIALVLVLAIVAFFSATTVTAVMMANSTQNTASGSSGQQNAYALAEAGLSDALARLNGQLDGTGAIATGGTDPRTATLLPSTTLQFPAEHGSVTYSGTIDANYIWTITSTGSVKTSASTTSKRKLTQKVTVVGIDAGADGSSWSRFYQDSPTGACGTGALTIDNETFVTNVATRGNLCLINGGAVTGASTIVDAGGTVTITGPDTSGLRSPSAGTGWTNPTNVYTDNNVYATNAITAASTGATQDTTGFGNALPATATIKGISVSVNRFASACCNSVQTITETGGPTGGTFTLKATPPGGSLTTSAAIAYNASAATVQTALVTIFGSGNVTCTGGPLPGGVVCTFGGSDAAKPVNTFILGTKSLTGGASPAPAFANTSTGSTGALQDSTVQLLKAGAAVGTNKASGTTWGTSESTVTYGNATDLWGTTWTAAQVDAANFGLRFIAKNVAVGNANATATGSLDYVSITVYYSADTNGIGTSVAPVATANIAGTCTYNSGAAHTPCTSADHVNAGTITATAAGANAALAMPQVDFNYWWANAKPGPKHFCTNPNPGLANNFFDNDAALAGTAPNQYTTGNTTGPNKSISINGEMAPNNSDYTCQVWSVPPTGGTLLGELSWNHTTHVLNIKGVIFVDGNFRFDEDGEVIHYFGRADIMSSRDDEIDALVCAGGSGTTWATSCITDMKTWDANSNMMVLMSQEANEYDQGGTSCAGNTPPTCYNGHLPGGFQGIMYSTADCLIHQNFQDSGPVICNTITLPDEGGVNPTFYTFPSTGNLTDGQKYADTATASHFQLTTGQESG